VSRSPERIAWAVLSAALLTCCALTVGVPMAGLAFYNSAMTEAGINVQLQAGQMSVWRPNQSESDPPSVVSLDGYDVSGGSLIALSTDSAGLLTAFDRRTEPAQTLFTAQLYANARLRVERVRLPRFPASAAQDEYILYLSEGRIQITLPQTDRKFHLQIASDHAAVWTKTPGSYIVEVNSETLRLHVASGSATVMNGANDLAVNLSAGQRTIATRSSLAGALPPPRNLVRNGQFTPPLQPAWTIETRTGQPDATPGVVRVTEQPAGSALLLERLGTNLGWGRTGIAQTLDARVDGVRDLRLVIEFAILLQELPVCASLGSECPLLVAITWRDDQENSREWIQGFYAAGTPQMSASTALLPDTILANPQRKHVKVPLGQPVRWETDNLLPYLPNVRTIESLKIYAEGHAVQAQVFAVALLVE
jgi:hypothetical protein